jgi:hypothetical protein
MTKGGGTASVKREGGAAGTIASSDLACIAKERRVGSGKPQQRQVWECQREGFVFVDDGR